MALEFFNEKQERNFLNKLKKQFGILEIPGILIKRGKERIFLFEGNLSKGEIKKLERSIPIERMGVYFGKEFDDGVRLSIEGVHILENQITDGVFELNEDQAQRWMEGQELNIKTGKKGYLIMKYKNDFLGCGKASELKIGNFIPKNRRLKIKTQ